MGACVKGTVGTGPVQIEVVQGGALFRRRLFMVNEVFTSRLLLDLQPQLSRSYNHWPLSSGQPEFSRCKSNLLAPFAMMTTQKINVSRRNRGFAR